MTAHFGGQEATQDLIAPDPHACRRDRILMPSLLNPCAQEEDSVDHEKDLSDSPRKEELEEPTFLKLHRG